MHGAQTQERLASIWSTAPLLRAACGAVPIPMPEQDRWVETIRPVVQSSRGEQRKIFARFQDTTDFPVAEGRYAYTSPVAIYSSREGFAGRKDLRPRVEV